VHTKQGQSRLASRRGTTHSYFLSTDLLPLACLPAGAGRCAAGQWLHCLPWAAAWTLQGAGGWGQVDAWQLSCKPGSLEHDFRVHV